MRRFAATAFASRSFTGASIAVASPSALLPCADATCASDLPALNSVAQLLARQAEVLRGGPEALRLGADALHERLLLLREAALDAEAEALCVRDPRLELRRLLGSQLPGCERRVDARGENRAERGAELLRRDAELRGDLVGERGLVGSRRSGDAEHERRAGRERGDEAERSGHVSFSFSKRFAAKRISPPFAGR